MAAYEELEGKRKDTRIIASGGYTYKLTSIRNNISYLACRESYCSATAKLQNGLLIGKRPHTHEPSPQNELELKARSMMRQRASHESTRLRDIYDRVLDENPPGSLVRCAMALPLLPANLVLQGVEDLANRAAPYANLGINRFFAYLDSTWVRGVGAEQLSVQGQPRRTNNVMESYHAGLLRKFGIAHPDPWKFLSQVPEGLLLPPEAVGEPVPALVATIAAPRGPQELPQLGVEQAAAAVQGGPQEPPLPEAEQAAAAAAVQGGPQELPLPEAEEAAAAAAVPPPPVPS
ncbi:unnamed protein product, partial [Darwinula stevensoni]